MCVSVLSSLVAAAAGGQRSVAQDYVTLGDWDFVPTLDGGRVESFVVLLDPALAVGDNITAVWFRRSDDTSWQSFAWSDASNLEAIAHVKSTLGLPDSTDTLWPDADAQQGVGTELAVAPDAFAKGVFADDAFAPVIQSSPEPGPIIGGLAGVGYPAAALPIQVTPTNCAQHQVLATLAAMVEADIGTGANGALMAAFEVPYSHCDYWRSLAATLDDLGTWTMPDLSEFTAETTGVPVAVAWQSVPSGMTFGGPQAVIVDVGGLDGDGDPVTAAKLVIALEDVTPPTLEVVLLGDGQPPMVSPGGLDYFLAPVTISAVSSAFDNVDSVITNSVVSVDASVGCEGPSPVVIASAGYYSYWAKATDSSGNTTYHKQLFEVRDRWNLDATAVVESLAVVPGSPLDTVDAVILLTSDIFESEDINLATLALWLSDSAGETVGTRPLRLVPGYVIGEGYDPALVNLQDGVWRLAVRGQVPTGALGQAGIRFSITGSGSHGTPEEFDFMVVEQQLTVEPNPEAALIAQAVPVSTADMPPPAPPALPCEWRSQFVQDDPPVDVVIVDTSETCVYDNCAVLQFALFASPYDFGGYAHARETCPTFCQLKQEKDAAVISGGRMKIWLEGDDCCPNCEIDVSARPRFRASASINHRATAGALGSLGIAIPGCGQVVAAGGVGVTTEEAGSIGLSTPWGGVEVPYSTQDTEDSDTFAAQSACTPYEHCSIEIGVVSQARLEVVAESTLIWGSGGATARLRGAAVRLKVTPHVVGPCFDVIRDGVDITYDMCSPWENEP